MLEKYILYLQDTQMHKTKRDMPQLQISTMLGCCNIQFFTFGADESYNTKTDIKVKP